nr:uncharacterized protein CTRU02_07465 [Colletotrichum truncatum]KAF6791125.1 hypothetical protein CTRU02_07465 [Colletotrichum truncatum]
MAPGKLAGYLGRSHHCAEGCGAEALDVLANPFQREGLDQEPVSPVVTTTTTSPCEVPAIEGQVAARAKLVNTPVKPEYNGPQGQNGDEWRPLRLREVGCPDIEEQAVLRTASQLEARVAESERGCPSPKPWCMIDCGTYLIPRK